MTWTTIIRTDYPNRVIIEAPIEEAALVFKKRFKFDMDERFETLGGETEFTIEQHNTLDAATLNLRKAEVQDTSLPIPTVQEYIKREDIVFIDKNKIKDIMGENNDRKQHLQT